MSSDDLQNKAWRLISAAKAEPDAARRCSLMNEAFGSFQQAKILSSRAPHAATTKARRVWFGRANRAVICVRAA